MVKRERWLDEDGEEIREMSIAELYRYLPQMLTWEDEPQVRSGDIYVFRWGKIHGRYDAPNLEDDDPRKNRAYQANYPEVFIRLTANPVRHKKGHWQAPFVRVGFDTTEYMKRGGGSVPTPLAEVVIDREVPLEQHDRESNELDEEMRAAKRRKEAASERRPGRRERQLRRAA